MLRGRKPKEVAYFAIILLLSFAAFFLFNRPTGLVVAEPVEPEIMLDLGNVSEYHSGDAIAGTIKITLGGITDPDEKFRLEIGSTTREKKITEVLDLLNKSYKFSEAETLVTSPALSKTLNINVNQPAAVALSIPKNAILEPVTFNFKAATGSSLNFPKIDVGGDGFIEWEYIGEQTGWGATVYPEGTTQPPVTNTGKISDDFAMFCELVDFPKATDFYVQALYKKLGTEGDAKAAILSLPPGSGSPGSASLSVSGQHECNLAEHTTMKWGSCNITLDYNIRGYNLICIYSSDPPDQQDNLYEIPLESIGGLTQTSYTCIGETCSLISLSQKFYFRLQAGVYDGTLAGTTSFNFAEHYTLPLIDEKDPITTEIERYLSACVADKLGLCIVPMAFSADNSGIGEVSNLEVPYSAGFIGGQVGREFYTLAKSGIMLESAGGTDLTSANYTFSFPLSRLGNITAPSVSTPTTITVKAYIGSDMDMKQFLVYPAGYHPSQPTPAGVPELEGLLKETKTKLEALKNNPSDEQKKIMGFLDLESAIGSGLTALSGYEDDLQAVKDGMGDVDIQKLKGDIESFRSNQVKDIAIESSLTDIVLVEPDDITTDIVPEERHDETVFLQDKVEMKATIKSYAVRLFDETAERGHLIELSITPKEDLKKMDVFVMISKDAIENVAKIKFDKSPDQIVNPDPTVKWYFPALKAGEAKEIAFLAETGLDVSPTDFKMIIARAIEELECESDDECEEDEVCDGGYCVPSGEEGPSECGDGICTTPLEDEMICPEDCKAKFPWIPITIAVAVATFLGLYINLYRGKGSFRELTRGKSPFKNEQDMYAVMQFVKASLGKGLKAQQVGQSLKQKGWNDRQVNFAMEEMQWVKDLDSALKAVPMKGVELGPMKLYVEKAILKGVKKADMVNNLVSRGWDPGKVKKAYMLTKMNLAWKLFMKKMTFSKKRYGAQAPAAGTATQQKSL